MKLDFDLIRELLLYIEKASNGVDELSIFRFTEALPKISMKAIDLIIEQIKKRP